MYCGRTGAVICDDCSLVDCRASGVVVGHGGVVEVRGGEVRNCRGLGAVALGGCKLLVRARAEGGGVTVSGNTAGGLSAREGALLQVEGATVSTNGECGVRAEVGSTVVLTRCTIRCQYLFFCTSKDAQSGVSMCNFVRY